MASVLGKRRRPSGKRYVTQRARKTYRSSRYVPSGVLSIPAPLRTGGYYGMAARGEKKTIDVDPTTFEVTTTATLNLINGVATGSDFTDRIGRKIKMTSWSIRAFWAPTDSLVDTSTMRFMIVLDLQPNGAAATITDILKSSNVVSQLNLNNRDRFRVLMDKVVTSGPLTAAFVGTPITGSFKKYKKCMQDVIFSGTLSTIGSIATGALYFVTLGNNGAGAGRNITWSSRVRFVDA